jgi:hypothetical protein
MLSGSCRLSPRAHDEGEKLTGLSFRRIGLEPPAGGEVAAGKEPKLEVAPAIGSSSRIVGMFAAGTSAVQDAGSAGGT